MAHDTTTENESAYLAEYESRVALETVTASRRRVHFVGELAAAVGKSSMSWEVARPCDIFRGLILQVPEAADVIRRGNWRIFEGERELDAWELFVSRVGPSPDLRIMPAPEGADDSGIGKIFGGLFLAVFGLVGGAAVFGSWASTVVGVGAVVGLSGIARALAPTPPSDFMDREEAGERQTNLFSRASTLEQQGQAVPLVYGTALTGGLRVKSDIQNVRTFGSPQVALVTGSHLAILDVVSEGVIDGLENDRAGILLDGQPLENALGDSDATITATVLDGSTTTAVDSSVSSMVQVNKDVTNSVPVSITLTDSQLTSTQITLSWPAFYHATTTVPPQSTTVEFSFEIDGDVAGSPGTRTGFADAIGSSLPQFADQTKTFGALRAVYKWDQSVPTTPLAEAVTVQPVINSVYVGLREFYSDVRFIWEYPTLLTNPTPQTCIFYYRHNPIAAFTQVEMEAVPYFTGYGSGSVWEYYVDFQTPVIPTPVADQTYGLVEIYVDADPVAQRPNKAMLARTLVYTSTVDLNPVELEGLALNPYELDIDIDFDRQTASMQPPYEIRISRITADLASTSLSRDAFQVSRHTDYISADLAYPDTALVNLTGKAQSFGGRIPDPSYIVNGIKCRIPVGYNPATGQMPAVWTGGFQASKAWTNDPAWILYDLLTGPERYSLGLTDAEVDKFSFGEASRRNGDQVDDHEGGLQNRYTFNGSFSRHDDALKILTAVASSMDAQIWVGGGIVYLSQDRPASTARIFSNANVVDGNFRYIGTASSGRTNIARVSWRNPANRYEAKVETIERPYQVDRFGRREVAVDAIGVTNLGQARRRGKFITVTAEAETQQVLFKVSTENALMGPGDIIEISDAHREGARHGGRVLSSVTFGIHEVFLVDALSGAPDPWASGYTFSTVLADGTFYSEPIVAVTTAPPPDVYLFAAAALGSSQSVGRGAPFVITSPTVAPKKYRVISIAEDSPQVFEVMAIEHDADKWTLIDDPAEIGSPTTYPADSWPPT